MPSRRLAALAAAAALCSFSGCGDDAPQAEKVQGAVSVRAENGRVEIPRRPERIVSISPTATEHLFAVGAGDQVVAVDEFSNYPPAAPRTKLSYANPNAEAIAEYEPDLVVVSLESDRVVPALERLRIPVLVFRPASDLKEAYRQIEQVGLATRHSEQAAAVVERMKERVAETRRRLRDEPRRFSVYHELDPTYYSATSETFVGRIYGMLGLENIADRAMKAGEYPQLSAEYVVRADPDLIVLADTICCDQDRAAVAKRPGMAQVAAVRNGDVVAVRDDVASRWGPRIVDFMETVGRRVERMHRRR
jgi:iron complex transport system substrate-binding protein